MEENSKRKYRWPKSDHLSLREDLPPRVKAAIRAALSMLGAPYVYGAPAGGTSCFDCSSFVQWAWKQAGISLPRTAAEQLFELPPGELGKLSPGDLLFYRQASVEEPSRYLGVNHVAMFLGDGLIIEAGSCATGVHITHVLTKCAPVGVARPADTPVGLT